MYDGSGTCLGVKQMTSTVQFFLNLIMVNSYGLMTWWKLSRLFNLF